MPELKWSRKDLYGQGISKVDITQPDHNVDKAMLNILDCVLVCVDCSLLTSYFVCRDREGKIQTQRNIVVLTQTELILKVKKTARHTDPLKIQLNT